MRLPYNTAQSPENLFALFRAGRIGQASQGPTLDHPRLAPGMIKVSSLRDVVLRQEKKHTSFVVSGFLLLEMRSSCPQGVQGSGSGRFVLFFLA
jgi:hypothetical protein